MAVSVTDICLIFLVLSVVSCDSGGDECSRPPDETVCNFFFVRMAWYYKPQSQECVSFMYGGCGNTSNVYRSEEECYIHCTEKLVTLHPPWNVKAMAIQSTSTALIWYRPFNYNLHKELQNKYLEKNMTNHSYTTVNNSSVGNPGAGLVHVVLHRTETGLGTGSNTTQTTDSTVTHTDTSTGTQSTNSTVETGTDTTNSTATTGHTGDNTKDNVTTHTDNNTVTTPSTDNNTVTPKPDDITEKPATPKPSDSTKKVDSTTAAPSKESTDKPPQNTTSESAGGSEATPPDAVEELGDKNLSLSDYIGKVKVPFHWARLTHYILSYKAVYDPGWTNVTVVENTTFFNLSGLRPSTEYFVRLSAVYYTNTTLAANTITFRTKQDPSEARKCYCDPHGTVGGIKECSLSLRRLPWCRCRPGRAGLFCEICQQGFYNTGPTMPCHKCPCTRESSTGSCHFVEGYLHCLKCREGYSGILCHRCANGYYRDYNSEKAECQKCVGCHNISPGLICDPYSGKCLNCHYNTTGHQCDKCLPGFKGDPLKNIPCMPGESKFKPPSSGIIASIVVGTIVLLSGTVGIIVYRRVQRSPVNRPFWTIEFQEDHEGVNFSSVPDDDADRHVDDLQFYEDHQKTKSKSQPYSRLQEDC